MHNFQQKNAVDCIVVGTGAAGYHAACRMAQFGQKSVAIVTEGVNCGTSRNTGSDKQTYYKLGLQGDTLDSVRTMAENLFSCGAVDGDHALCEAALSVRCFLNLCELGVAFPVNRYGEYVGYKTDHDPFARATSAGPLTSKFMTEALEKKAKEYQIPIYDGLLAIEILKDEGHVCGLLCLEKSSGEFVVIRCGNIILATGGPAGIYADSVYPHGHTGSSSLAIQAGASLQNMTEWQYGLASVRPRWNVSGTYMQVLPRFISIDEEGNEYEFLSEYYSDPYEALSAVFLKGYQWPFDSKKVMDGSSVIDLLVYRECVLKKRRVFLDYRSNPFDLSVIDYEKLQPEAQEYLRRAQACFGTPIDRLAKMNQPAIDLYLGKGLDLHSQRLEIALCAQHNNGGIGVNLWWQTEVPGLFAAGECAGTHGITRPGGSALNAGQVGSLRAAQYISARGQEMPDEKRFLDAAIAAIEKHYALYECALQNEDNAKSECHRFQRKMSDVGGAIRDQKAMEALLHEIQSFLSDFSAHVGVSEKNKLYHAYKLKDALLCQAACLTALIDFAKQIGQTRGSALYTDSQGELKPGLEEIFRFRMGNRCAFDQIQEVRLDADGWHASWRPVRPLPENDDFFENVWRAYRENQNIF